MMDDEEERKQTDGSKALSSMAVLCFLLLTSFLQLAGALPHPLIRHPEALLTWLPMTSRKAVPVANNNRLKKKKKKASRSGFCSHPWLHPL